MNATCQKVAKFDQIKSARFWPEVGKNLQIPVNVDFFPKDIFLGPVWALSVGVYVRCERRESVPR